MSPNEFGSENGYVLASPLCIVHAGSFPGLALSKNLIYRVDHVFLGFVRAKSCSFKVFHDDDFELSLAKFIQADL